MFSLSQILELPSMGKTELLVSLEESKECKRNQELLPLQFFCLQILRPSELRLIKTSNFLGRGLKEERAEGKKEDRGLIKVF